MCCPQLPVARGNASRFDVSNLERHYLATQQCHNPAYRPDEARAVFAGPVHRLGKRDLENDPGQRTGQDVSHGSAWNQLGKNVVAVFLLQVRGHDALLTRETSDRFFRGIYGRPRAFLTFIALALGKKVAGPAVNAPEKA